MKFFKQNIKFLYLLSVIQATNIFGAAKISQPEDDNSKLLKAVEENRKWEIESLLQRGANINAVDKHGYTPLFIAVEHHNLNVVKLLLEKGADVNKTAAYGATALIRATETTLHPKIIAELIKYRADVNAEIHRSRQHGDGSQTVIKHSPLQNIIKSGDECFDLVKLLIVSKADVNFSGTFGETVLQTASGKHDWRIVKLLIDAKANVNALGVGGSTALRSAYNNSDIINLLLDAKADLNIVDRNNKKQGDYIRDTNWGSLIKIVDQEPVRRHAYLDRKKEILMAVNLPISLIDLIDSYAYNNLAKYEHESEDDANKRVDSEEEPLIEQAAAKKRAEIIKALADKNIDQNSIKITTSYLFAPLHDYMEPFYSESYTNKFRLFAYLRLYHIQENLYKYLNDDHWYGGRYSPFIKLVISYLEDAQTDYSESL